MKTTAIRCLGLLAVAFLLPACTSDARPGRADTQETRSDMDTSSATASSGEVASAPRAASTERSARRVNVGGLDLTGIGYDKGSPDASVVVVDFSDFGCPFCGSHARETLPALEREFIATGKVFYKYVPFVMGMFPNGDEAARAAECAAEQGKFWAMHDRLYVAQREWKRARDPAPLFRSHAASLGLEPAAFAACIADGRTDARTARATEAATQLGVRATPSFVINGQPVEGALPLPQFRQVLEAAARGKW